MFCMRGDQPSWGRLGLVLLCALSAPHALGQDDGTEGNTTLFVSWISDSSGNWSTTSNWSSFPLLPGLLDNVTIDRLLADPTVTHSSGTDTILSLICTEPLVVSGGTLDVTLTAVISSDFTLSSTFSSGGLMTVTGPMTWRGGGTLSGGGLAEILSPGSLTIDGSANLERALNVAAPTTWSAGTITFTDGTFTNQLGATFTDTTGDGTRINDGGGTNEFINSGTYVRNGEGTSDIRVPFDNRGTVRVEAGALEFSGGGEGSGVFSLWAGSTLRFDGDFSINSEASFTGTGGVEFVAGTQTFNTDLSLGTRAITLDGATMTGAGDLTQSGPMTWSKGTLSGTGTTTIQSSGTLDITGTVSLARSLFNSGTITWTSGVVQFNGGTLTNYSNGTILAQAGDASKIDDVSGTNSLVNNGTFERDGTGTTTVYVPFSNFGPVNITAGALDFKAFSGGGTLTVDSGATLRLSGTNSISSTCTITGGGTVTIPGGTQTIDNQTTVSVGTLEQTGGTIDGTANLLIASPMTWSGGDMIGTGTTRIEPSGSLTVSDAVDLSRQLDNLSTVTWTAGNIDLLDGTINNLSGATFVDATAADYKIKDLGGINSVTNDGTFLHSGAGNTEIKVPFDNSGTVSVTAGSLKLAGGGRSTGLFDVAGGASLIVSASHTFATGTTFTGAGSVEISGGTFTLDAHTSFEDVSLSLAGATITGDADMVIEGPVSWTGGAFEGAGATIVESGGELTIAGSGTLRRPLQNKGHTLWTSGGILFEDATFTNTGTFDDQAVDVSKFGNLGGTNLFLNQGTYTRNGTGESEIAVPLTTSGWVYVTAGTLRASGGYTQTAKLTQVDSTLVVPGAGVQLDGGLFGGRGTLQGHLANNAGNVAPGMDGVGVLTIAGNYTQAAAGVLEIQVGGTTAGVETDLLAVTGPATIDGALIIRLLDGYVPAPGDSVAILSSSNLTGTFASFTVEPEHPDPSLMYDFELAYESGAVVLKMAEPYDPTDPSDQNCTGDCGFRNGILEKGVVIHVAATGILPDLVVPDGVIIQGIFTWAEVESAPGVYDWTVIDQYLDETDGIVCFKCITVGGDIDPDEIGDPDYEIPDNDATPAWLFDDPDVAYIGGHDTEIGTLPKYPVYWDPEYLAYLESFVNAVGERYNNHPRVEFMRPCGWQISSNESNFYGDVGPYLVDEIHAAGMPEYVPGEEIPRESAYTDAVLAMLTMWRAAFAQTQLFVTVALTENEETFSDAMNDAARLQGYGVTSTRLNECQEAGNRQTLATWKAEDNTKGSWGGITNLGACDPNATLLDAFMQGIGSIEDDLLPLSNVSYVTFSTREPELQPDEEEAIDWAMPRLVP